MKQDAFHLAQVNIGRMRAPLDEPLMAGLRQRGDLVQAPEGPGGGHQPSIDEAKKRLAHLSEKGPTPYAFTFRTPFPPDQSLIEATDWSSFEPCPST